MVDFFFYFQALILARSEKESLEMQRNRLQHKCKDLGEDFRARLIKYVEDISVSECTVNPVLNTHSKINKRS